MSPVFYFLALLTVAGAVGSMSLRNPVHCALSLVVAFVGLAGIYLGLGAQFLGLAQVLVYVGAVAILLVFVLLLTRGGEPEAEAGRVRMRWLGVLVAMAVTGVLVAALVATPLPALRVEPPEIPTVRSTGEALMADYVIPLQVVGVLLTAAMIGAAVLALPERGGRGGREEPRGGAR